ncbi:MAG: nucleotidyltransferase domain-containing protein [Campylobacterota bacterium]|nr:nucleotidyltransferase domain-containing protein [Campylobacterota bacterium]
MDIINLVNKKLSSIQNIKYGYIFGSYADDTFTKKSDLDIALYLENNNLDSKLQIIYELSKLLKIDVDLVVLNDTKNIYLQENILKYGVIVKDNIDRFDFEIKAWHNILDFKAFRRYIDAA